MAFEKLVTVEMPAKNWLMVLSILQDAITMFDVPNTGGPKTPSDDTKSSAQIIMTAMQDAGEMTGESHPQSVLKRVEEASKGR